MDDQLLVRDQMCKGFLTMYNMNANANRKRYWKCYSTEKRSLEMVTRNVTLKDFVDIEEKCSYLPHPENPEWTLVRQQTSIKCTSGPALKSVAEKIEQKCVEKFQQNSQRGREVVESVCRALERAESTAVATKMTATKNVEPLLVSSPVASQLSSSSTRRPSNFIVRRILERAEFVGATL